ncbi:zinc dependent phospholipase C family protein [Hymenobacter humi]|uniref:Zinc dependent phospholipase C family protein n=1 Tax=Hymenobacter humi TaxID=1411620 RepID=A0ABW2UEV8_9BACT
MFPFSIPRRLFLVLLLLAVPSLLFAWGAWSHQRINRAAVLALPPELRTFFYNHADFVTEEAVMPDARKFVLHDRAEGPRHFINLEAYPVPLDQLPRTAAEARKLYDAATLAKNGTLPWTIQENLAQLTQAMKNGRKDEILFLAADLGHYLGDAQMPLHTSANHDGQLTGQTGIHAFFEGQLPELFGAAYRFDVGPATYLPDPVAETWRLLAGSYASADTLLAVERQLQAAVPAADRYEHDAQGAIRKTQFNDDYHASAYATRYHQALGSFVERRLRLAVQSTANFWFTAWVNAGRPDLRRLDADYATRSNAHNLKHELRLLKKGRWT